MSSTIEVAAGLIFRAGKLLITQRRPHDHLGGLWEFPGGKREANESFEDCLKRELREELNVQTTVFELISDITHTYPEKTVRIKFFRCQLLQGEPEPLGCSAVRWVSQNELGDYTFPAADKSLLAQLLKTPEWWAGLAKSEFCSP